MLTSCRDGPALTEAACPWNDTCTEMDLYRGMTTEVALILEGPCMHGHGGWGVMFMNHELIFCGRSESVIKN
ncbi:hypothetical protein QQ045_029568 [Rhodiola kirilowii]